MHVHIRVIMLSGRVLYANVNKFGRPALSAAGVSGFIGLDLATILY